MPHITMTVENETLLLPCSRYVIEIGIPFLAFAPVRILRVFVYCSEVRLFSCLLSLTQQAILYSRLSESGNEFIKREIPL